SYRKRIVGVAIEIGCHKRLLVEVAYGPSKTSYSFLRRRNSRRRHYVPFLSARERQQAKSGPNRCRGGRSASRSHLVSEGRKFAGLVQRSIALWCLHQDGRRCRPPSSVSDVNKGTNSPEGPRGGRCGHRACRKNT